jgi:DNA helicase-2/ATP-dependent DNA helicase PcrA
VRDDFLPQLYATRLLNWWKGVSDSSRERATHLDDMVARLGFAVATFHASAHPGTLGFLEPGEDLIFLRAGLPEPIRRFTLAHELGHALMHRRADAESIQVADALPPSLASEVAVCADADFETLLGVWGLGDEMLRPGQAYSARAQREAEANIFASALLLPADQVRAVYFGAHADAAIIRTLTRSFGVSEDVALRRLTSLLATEVDDPAANGALSEPEDRADSAIALDEEQRAAAESRTPALVIAGPGTGKTSTLVGRIEWLTQAQGIPPERILALTFSNKAAREMRARVTTLLARTIPEPSDAVGAIGDLRRLAPGPAISTIHAYCGELLRQYGVLVGLRPDFLLVGQTEGYFLLRSLVARLPLTYYQPVTAPSHYYPDLLAAISRAKDELVDPVQYAALAAAALEAAVTTEEREQAERACEVARVYSAYQAALEERGDADFGDIIRLAVRLLEEHPDVLAEASARHLHVLVDEFQDINRAMGVFLRALTGETGTLWTVGDPDQAIYRFRGASPANIARFREDYAGAHIQRLRRNYRSQAPILGAAASVAARYIPAQTRQPLLATRGRAGTSSVRLATAPDEQSELDGLVRAIRSRLDERRSHTDIAVLCRTRRGAQKVIAALGKAEIPTRVVAPLLEQDEIKSILSVALLLTDPSGAGLLRAGHLTSHPIAREDVQRVLELAHSRAVSPMTIARESLDEVPDLEPQSRESLAHLVDVTHALSLAPDVATGLARYLFTLTTFGRDLLRGVATGDEVTRLRAAHVARLLSLARAFEDQRGAGRAGALASRPGDARWDEFLEYVRVLTELRQDAAGSEDLVASADEGVWVLTVHASKGLEFPVVLLPGLAERRFPVQPRHDFAPPPPRMIAGIDDADEADPHIVEEACLFYVALTRARDELVMSVAERYGVSSYRPSRFLAPIEARLGEQLAHERWEATEPAPAASAAHLHTPAAAARDVAPLSVFALETYQRCPRQFAYRFVDGLHPHSPGVAALLASLKRSLDTVHERMRENGSAPTLDEALALFELAYYEARHPGQEDDPYSSLYLRYGRLAMEGEWRALTTPETEVQESALRVADRDRDLEIQIDDIAISVTIDQVEQATRGASGAPRKPDTTGLQYVRRKLGAADDRGGLREYLYALAAEQHANGATPAQVAQRQVTTGDVTPVVFSERRRATLRRDLHAILDGIRQGEYPARPDPRTCAACPFLLICPS